MKCKLTVTTVLLLFFAVLSFGADYYVNANSGSDSNAGTSPGAAWQTVTYAVDNVVGTAEDPVTINISAGTYDWNIGEFFGMSYFCDPRGQTLAEGSRDGDDIVVADLNLDMIGEVRDVWQFFRDRRPETYGPLITP